jgi:ribonuclease P protein component
MPETTASKQKRKSSAFGRQARLGCHSEIELVKKNGLAQTGKFCVVVVLKTPPDGQRRVAFLISRRYDRLAVRRNRARRLFREVFHQIYHELPPLWMLMIPRRKMSTAKMPEVLEEVRRMMTRLQLWRS